MDKEYFVNTGIPTPLHFEQSPVPNWQSHPSEFLFNSNWDNKSTDQYSNFDSTLSSLVSSPAASNSTISQDNFKIRELIGKLNTTVNSGEFSPAAATAAYFGSRSTTSSPSKSVHYPIMDHFGNEKLLILGNSMGLNPNLVSSDPGFAERAAKFSCFGSRSFNGRTMSQLPYRSSSSLIGCSEKLSRVSSSPLLEADGSPIQTHMEMDPTNGLDAKFSKVSGSSASFRAELGSSNECSSVSEQIPSGLKTPSDSNSRKRKAVSRGKPKDIASKAEEENDDTNTKRSKSIDGNSEMGSVKTEEDTKTGDEKANQKPPEPPKDYIHVRARRGQATDSHSLAERVRREKISERMKLLQDLVPNCNKVTGKALMLDEIINYVQSLQRQVEFLSMKLASVDFNMDSLLSKDEFQPNASLSHPIYPIDTSASAFFGHQTKEPPQVHPNFSIGAMTQCLMDPNIRRNNSMQPTSIDEFGRGLQQFPTLGEDDLQSIVQMGFGQNLEL